MKPKLFFLIAIRIIIFFSIMMALSFVPEHLRDFFGDKLMDKQTLNECHGRSCMDDMYEWGARHYMYFWGVVILMILSLIDMVVFIANKVIYHYPNLKL